MFVYKGVKRFNRRRQKLWKNRRFTRREKAPEVVREPSIKVQAQWTVLEQFDLNEFSKQKTVVPEAEDIEGGMFGTLEYYDESYDRVSVKKSRPLQRCDNRMFYYVTTTDDEVIFCVFFLFVCM